jgi:hypothetical protein
MLMPGLQDTISWGCYKRRVGHSGCHAVDQMSSDNRVLCSVFAQTVPMCPQCQAESHSENAGSPPKKKSKLLEGNLSTDSETEDWRSQWHNKPILKPDITFFGQALDDAFDKCLMEDRNEVDLLIVIGTSLQVGSTMPRHFIPTGAALSYRFSGCTGFGAAVTYSTSRAADLDKPGSRSARYGPHRFSIVGGLRQDH